jgi:hypothetical protein
MGTHLNITKGISLKNESKSYFAISQLQKKLLRRNARQQHMRSPEPLPDGLN